MKRFTVSALLALGLLLTGGCSDSQSGDSYPDNQQDQAPGRTADEPEGVDAD